MGSVYRRYWLVSLFAVFCMDQMFADETATFQQCVLAKIKKASDSTTLGEIRSLCRDKLSTISTSKQTKKRRNRQRLSFSSHKSNYLFPISYNSTPNPIVFTQGLSDETIHNFEVVFQLSSKMRIIDNLFGDNGDLYGAYTGRFWWQAYNNDLSSPFRETNHEPELFLDFTTEYHFGEWDLTNVRYGMVHQSNGRSLPLSRSWNRLYMEFKLQDKEAWINFKPWFHVPEDIKVDENDPTGDDNPDIDRFMGYLELSAGYDFGKNHISSTIRNNLRSDNRGAFQLDWSFPILDSTDVRGYVQYFSGFGESLIDYNASTNRLSIGFIMSEANF